MIPLDLISSLVASTSFRHELTEVISGAPVSRFVFRPNVVAKVSRMIGLQDNLDFRKAIKEDEADLHHPIRQVLNSQYLEKQALCLQGSDAQIIMQLLRVVSKDTSDSLFRSQSYNLLRKLCNACHSLPEGLFIQGIHTVDKEDPMTGGFADVFRGSAAGGELVALKRLRKTQASEDNPKNETVIPAFSVANTCQLIILEVMQGLCYLHANKIVHGDLRGPNILIDDDSHVRLADFGLSNFTSASLATDTSNHHGSKRWMAPELLNPDILGSGGRFQRTTRTDIYSLACVFLELYSGSHPFSNIPSEWTVAIKVTHGERPQQPEINILPLAIWEIMERAWAQDPSHRPDAWETLRMIQLVQV
ncbi:hypothetical protein HWV62_9325 [Athelia sp. TMB]|nr:hypothetical protein HWV62_9325 [Athelia sp. TMB]